MKYEEYQHLLFEHRDDGILLVTINRPDVLNATNNRLHWELSRVWKDIDEDPETRVIVITGKGRAFSAGGDLEMIDRMKGSAANIGQAWREAGDIVYNMINLDKPIISAINGVAVGAGLAVAFMADVSIASENMRITDGHIRLGVAAGDHAVIIWPLLCGMAKAKYYLLTADFIDGKEAERIGLVSLCVPAEQLMDKAMEVAQKLARGPQQAVRFTKRALNNWLRMFGPAFDASLALEMMGFFSDDLHEGVAALKGTARAVVPEYTGLMKACMYRAPGAPLEIAKVPDPIPGPGELVVRVKACGICGSDLHAAGRNFRMPPGTILGHEFAGVVETLGDGVEGFERGDPVVVMSYLGCGECEPCRIGDAQRCRQVKLVGFGEVPGGYAELMKTRPASVFKIPPGMSFHEAATVEPLVVGLHGLHRAGFQAGESCVVMGAGPIGIVTMLWARFAGARAVVVSELTEHRRRLALEMGADAAVDPRMRNPAGMIEQLTGAGPQVIFECIGAPGAMAEAIAYAQRASRVVVIGVCTEDDGFAPITAMSKELDMRFSLGMERAEIEMAIAMLAAGRVATAPMVTHTMGIDDLPKAFAALALPTNQSKVIIDF